MIESVNIADSRYCKLKVIVQRFAKPPRLNTGKISFLKGVFSQQETKKSCCNLYNPNGYFLSRLFLMK